MRSPVPLAAILILASSCSFNAQCGGARVDRDRMEALVRTLGEGVDNVATTSCPADVEPEVGRTFECTVTFADGSAHPAVVTITAVHEGKIRAETIWKTALLGRIKRAEFEALITERTGVKASLACKPGVLALDFGERLRCTVRSPIDEAPIDLWFTDHNQIHLEINPDAPDTAAEAPKAEAPTEAPKAEAPAP